MKRVLVVTGWYPTPRNPISGVFVREQAEALAERYSVAVLHLVPLSQGFKERRMLAGTEPAERRLPIRRVSIPAPRPAGPIFYWACRLVAQRAGRELAGLSASAGYSTCQWS
jgi:hypothetical protein